MPPTGAQSDRPRNVTTDGEVEPWHVDQILQAITGDYGMRWRLIGYNSSANYALELRNLDPTNGLALLCWDNTGLSLLDVRKAQTTVAPGFVVLDAAGTTTILSAFLAGVTVKPAFALRNASNVVLIDASDSGVNFRDRPTVGGVSVALSTDAHPAPAVSGTYVGNGGTGGRQIPTGFPVRQLTLQSNSTTNTWITTMTTQALFLGTGPSIQVQSSVHIHASDGFVVGDGATSGNVNLDTYTYVAFR